VRRRGQAYQAAMEAVFAIPIAIGIGWFADSQLGSSPIGLFLGVGFGFAACVIRLMRMRGMVEAEAAKAERDPNNQKMTPADWAEQDRERDE
jgi:F0F1-type ATP synthase assembly protein I